MSFRALNQSTCSAIKHTQDISVSNCTQAVTLNPPPVLNALRSDSFQPSNFRSAYSTHFQNTIRSTPHVLRVPLRTIYDPQSSDSADDVYGFLLKPAGPYENVDDGADIHSDSLPDSGRTVLSPIEKRMLSVSSVVEGLASSLTEKCRRLAATETQGKQQQIMVNVMFLRQQSPEVPPAQTVAGTGGVS